MISPGQLVYEPLSVFEQLAQGRVDFFEHLTRLFENVPEGRQLLLYFSAHVVLLIIAVILAIYSLVFNSTNGYAITAILAIIAVLILNTVTGRLSFMGVQTTDAASLVFVSSAIFILSALASAALKKRTAPSSAVAR